MWVFIRRYPEYHAFPAFPAYLAYAGTLNTLLTLHTLHALQYIYIYIYIYIYTYIHTYIARIPVSAQFAACQPLFSLFLIFSFFFFFFQGPNGICKWHPPHLKLLFYLFYFFLFLFLFSRDKPSLQVACCKIDTARCFFFSFFP